MPSATRLHNSEYQKLKMANTHDDDMDYYVLLFIITYLIILIMQ